MTCIWKFVLPMPNATGRSFIDMPSVVVPVIAGMQNDELMVWAIVEPDAPAEEDRETHGPRRFIVVNTGDDLDLPEGARFLGSVASSNGIVWHVWDGDAETTA